MKAASVLVSNGVRKPIHNREKAQRWFLGTWGDSPALRRFYLTSANSMVYFSYGR